ncbi:hypothetical protein DPMN_194416 [Dreissena polymorpha]|uniref:Uncharacterized protein n=1 Tax=Dreissena polymorpha TaxID=45954 RepID=A0A9D3Y3B8_DREPO|nr:hypothetical protein DPMN_194416 [Dreissena polymorpha]
MVVDGDVTEHAVSGSVDVNFPSNICVTVESETLGELPGIPDTNVGGWENRRTMKIISLTARRPFWVFVWLV